MSCILPHIKKKDTLRTTFLFFKIKQTLIEVSKASLKPDTLNDVMCREEEYCLLQRRIIIIDKNMKNRTPGLLADHEFKFISLASLLSYC